MEPHPALLRCSRWQRVMVQKRKRAKREYSYQRNYKASGISSSKRGSNFAHCDSCVTDINVGHGGVHDIKKYLATTKHQEMVKVTSIKKTLFRQSPIEQSVTQAEVPFANFIAEHNLPYLLSDHLTRAMFPDSQILPIPSCILLPPS